MPRVVGLNRGSAFLESLGVQALKPTFKRIIDLAQAFAGDATAAIMLIRGDETGWRAKTDEDWMPVIPVAESMCGVVMQTEGVLWVEDLTTDSRYENLRIAKELKQRFYAGVAIRGVDGEALGALFLHSTEPRPFDAAMVKHMADLAAIASDECTRQATIAQLATAQAEAAAAQQLADALISSAPVALCMTDRQMRVIKISPRWRAERQLEEKDVIGRVLYDLNPAAHAWRAAYERCLTGESVEDSHVQMTLPDGTQRWFRADIIPWRDVAGEIGGLLIMTLDITDMVEAMDQSERARARMDIAMRLAAFKVWEVDYRRQELTAALKPEERLGDHGGTYDDVKKDMWAAVHRDDRDRARQEWDDAMALGITWRTEYRYPRDDKEIWLEAAAEQIKGEDGRVTNVIGIYRDITPRKRAELELVKAKEAAEAANRAKSEFLANMSHEIRTPLNGVMGVAGALANTELTDGQIEMVGLIETSAKTLEALLSDILDLARIEAGRLEIKPEPFDLVQSVNTCAALFEAGARAKGLDFSAHVDAGARHTFDGDAPRIRQILCNLLSNAAKFTGEGAIALNVSSREDPDNDRTELVFEVTDTGIGFDDDTKARLFERFEQADGSITRRYGGSGLGLSISYSLAEAMGGALDADSTPGVGSTFRLILPLKRCAAAAAADPDLRHRQAQSIAGMRVLLAEDHPTNRRVVELILGAAGVDLTCVEDGEQAIEAFFTDGHFDLVLMDMQMPVMDGLTAIRIIRKREHAEGLARTPIYTLTANAMPEHATASRKAGACGHVTKPITAEGLLHAVAGAMVKAEAEPTDQALSA